jgi:hypothetical protein
VRRAASRLRRPLAGAAACATAATLALAGGAAALGARLQIESGEGPPDAPCWVCVDGAAPDSLRVELLGGGPAPAAGPAWSLAWEGGEPLRLLAALPPRELPGQLPFWDQDGSLPPGDYRLVAAGFAPETLRVREPTAGERRQRAVLARVRLRAAAGDSALAARLAQRLLEMEPGGPYADAAFLALGRLWRHSKFRERPADWLSEWIARHHSRCCVGDGIRVWLANVPQPFASAVLRRLASRYPETKASAAATAYLQKSAARRGRPPSSPRPRS